MESKAEQLIVNVLIGALGALAFAATVIDVAYNKARRRPILDTSTNGGVER